MIARRASSAGSQSAALHPVWRLLGGANVRFSNAISSILYATFIPLAVIGITLAFRRLKGDSVIEPHVSTRERDARKAARTQAAREAALGRAGLGTTG